MATDTFRVYFSSPKPSEEPQSRAPRAALHDFLQEKNISENLRNRVYADHFRLIELSLATVVYVQISKQLCVPFCLKRGGFFGGAKVFGRM